MLKFSIFENLKYYAPKKIEFSKPYNSVTEHPGPLKLWMVWTLIFGLVSKPAVRISKFALIKKLEKIKFFSWGGGVRHLGFRHPGFTHGYHSGRGNHGNGACCHGNRPGCHGNIGGSAARCQASIT